MGCAPTKLHRSKGAFGTVDFDNRLSEWPQKKPLTRLGKLEQKERISTSHKISGKIWAKIFTELTHWKDLKSCSDSCRAFRKIMQSRKTEWLFEAVLPLLNDLKNQNQDLLSCRLVSKKWKEIIDICYQHALPQSYTYPYSSTKNDLQWKLQHDPELWNSSPYLLGSVWIKGPFEVLVDPPCYQDHEYDLLHKHEFVEDVKRFLSKFGLHIKSLTITIDTKYLWRDKFSGTVLHALSVCTNLRELTIQGTYDDTNALGYTLLPETYDPVNLPDFTIGPQLKRVEVRMLVDFSKTLGAVIVECSSQLNTIKLANGLPEKFSQLNWQILETLQTFDQASLEIRPDCQTLLESLVKVKAPNLASLSICMDKKASMIYLLSTIRNFVKLDTLTMFFTGNDSWYTIDYLKSIPTAMALTSTLNKVKIKTIRWSSSTNLDFILFLPLLQNLEIGIKSISMSPSVKSVGMLEISTKKIMKQQLYWWGIWELLLDLKTLTVEFTGKDISQTQHKYTRKEYLFCRDCY